MPAEIRQDYLPDKVEAARRRFDDLYHLPVVVGNC